MSLGPPKETRCLNPMRYHSASIKNIFLPLTMAQSARIYDHSRVKSPIILA